MRDKEMQNRPLRQEPAADARAGEVREKLADRCDPHDSQPVAGYVDRLPELDIDTRIRQMVGRAIAQEGDNPTEEELALLDEIPVESTPLSPFQVQTMDFDPGPTDDVTAFVESLTDEDKAALAEAIREVDVALPPPEPPPESPPAE